MVSQQDMSNHIRRLKAVRLLFERRPRFALIPAGEGRAGHLPAGARLVEESLKTGSGT